jgi:hypothetical protein
MKALQSMISRSGLELISLGSKDNITVENPPLKIE